MEFHCFESKAPTPRPGSSLLPPSPIMRQPSSRSLDIIHSLLEKYSKEFARHQPGILPMKSYLNAVLVIGTRGGLGANALAQLLEHVDVTKVYALNRIHADGKTSVGRQADEFEWHALSSSLVLSPKLVLLEGVTSEKFLGLASEIYQEMSESITGIILNGWRVDFSSSLATFESAISGLRNIIDMALKSPQSRPPHLIFCSSTSIIHNSIAPPTPLLELSIEDPSVVAGQGYCESKWISEQIIAAATRETTLPTTIARLTQLTGSSNGTWKSNEWFPMIIKSSQIIGCLPTDTRSLNLLPARSAAIALVELMTSTVTIAHIVHPRPIRAETMMQHISESLKLPIVSKSEWLQRLEASVDSPTHGTDRTGRLIVRLLPFFQRMMSEAGQDSRKGAFNLPLMSSINAQKGAPSLIYTKPLGNDDIQGWLDFWQRTGFLERAKVGPARL